MPGSTNKKTNQWNSSSENPDGTRYTFKFNEQYSEPTYWSGSVKVSSVLDASEIHRCQFGHGLDSERLVAKPDRPERKSLTDASDSPPKLFVITFRNKPITIPPAKDKDGSYMQLADGYTVDYSRYE